MIDAFPLEVIMVVLSESTALTVSFSVSLSPIDIALLSTAYLPLIQADGLSVYLLLTQDTSFRSDGSSRFIKDLVNASGLTIESLSSSLRLLEGAGLLKTMYREDEKGDSLILMLEKPLAAEELFSSDLWRVILDRMGQTRFERIRAQLTDPILSTQGYIDCTESGASVFGLTEMGDSPMRKERSSRGADSTFRRSVSESLSSLGYSLKILGEDADSVFSQAILYGCTAPVTARLIFDSTGSDGVFSLDIFKRLLRDRMSFARPVEEEKLSERMSLGDSRTAKLIERLESLSVAEYLARYLGVSKAPAELLDLAAKFSIEYGYSAGVINAIFDYCFKATNSVPSSTYFEKVAIGLLPKHPKSAREAATALKEDRIDFNTRQKKQKTVSARIRAAAKELVDGSGEKKETENINSGEKLTVTIDADDILDLYNTGRKR